jgi:hypothetical protein
MDNIKACNILGIDPENISVSVLKTQYRKKALAFHPDKNKSVDANIRFQEINEAYHFLSNRTYYQGEDQDNPQDPDITLNPYTRTLFAFLENVIGMELFNHVQNRVFYKIIEHIGNCCEKKAMDILEKLDKTALIQIYEVLEMHQEVFHFSESFLIVLKEMIKRRSEKDEHITLYVGLEELMNDNLYKIKVGGNEYIIPLWHHELIYDHSGNELKIDCVPVLSEEIQIDENNNIHIFVEYDIEEIWEKDEIKVLLGKQEFTIYPRQLKLCKEQTLVFNEKGVSKINPKKIFEISKRADIILHITIHR